MLDKQELLRMLIEALTFEEITATSQLEAFLREMRDIDIDEITKIEIEDRIRRILTETIEHSRMLTEIIKGVMSSGRNPF